MGTVNFDGMVIYGYAVVLLLNYPCEQFKSVQFTILVMLRNRAKAFKIQMV